MISLEKARELRKAIVEASKNLDDETALESIELFSKWSVSIAYDAGDRVRYEDTLYKCIQAHTSQGDWTPDAAPALWNKVSLDEWPEWVQPTGAHDAYNTGDKVSHNGYHWVSLIDANTWEPGTAFTDSLWAKQ